MIVLFFEILIFKNECVIFKDFCGKLLFTNLRGLIV